MSDTYEDPTVDIIIWPDILRPDDDDEKAYSGLLEED